MTTSVKPQTNGKTKDHGKSSKVLVVKPAATPKEPAKPEVTLEDRLQHTEEMKALVDRRRQIVDSRVKIRQFQFGADEHSAKLVITDDHGRQFHTSNGFVITQLVDHIEQIISAKLKELDAQIMSFEI